VNIFGICLIKNEADIIEFCLEEGAKWATKIFVYDNGSEDDTWEIVNELARRNDKIVPYKKEALPFRDNLRAAVFNNYRNLAKEGDWWCFRMDSDEFYIDDPREFLKTIPNQYHVVAKASYDYRLTFEDVDEFKFQNRSPHDAIQLKYYNPLLYTEKRFFRHRNRLLWDDTKSFPNHMGILYPEYIKVKHLQYRSPQQMQDRLHKKKIATQQGYQYFKRHDNEEDWKELLIHRQELIKESPEWTFQGYKYPNLFKQSFLRSSFEKIMHQFKIYP